MKWELTKTLNGSSYWTLAGHLEKVRLRYNPDAQSIRLLSEEQRLYFMEKTGMLQSRILLKSEYNVVSGECFFSRNRHTGIIHVNDHKYAFNLTGELLMLYNRNKVAACETTVTGMSNLGLFEFSALLFGTCLVISKNLYQLPSPHVA